MKKCPECAGKMQLKTGKTEEGIAYEYYKCTKCGEELLNMKQLHDVAGKYRILKKYHVKLTKWGKSLGLRIPKEIAKKYSLKDNREVILIPEEDGLKIIP